MNRAAVAEAQFDSIAGRYDSMLNRGLSISGESKDYFAQKRAEWLAGSLRARGASPRRVLDFGCGTGTATPYLLEFLQAESITGVDVSAESLTVARDTYVDAPARFTTPSELDEVEFDVAYSNGTFHHILPDERLQAVSLVSDVLKPGGIFALWENNPWNPGTRYVMSRIPFDRDAIPLSPIESRRLLLSAGFKILCTNFLFLFPKSLSWLRPIEPALANWPLGAQYMVLAQKPTPAEN